jgi:hypothetical protein
MRAFISEIHDSTQGAVMAMSGASLALMVIALWGTSSTGLISMAAFAMTACLAWQLDDQSDHRFGTSSRKSGRPTI